MGERHQVPEVRLAPGPCHRAGRTAMSPQPRGASDLTVRRAIERYLRRRQSDSTDSSVEAWKYRLKLFREWCDSLDIKRVDELTGFDFDEYYELRASEIAPVTLEGEMWTLRMFAQYLEQLGVVDDEIHEAVRIPDLDPEDRSSQVALDAEPALALIEYYRNSKRDRATRYHAFLELAWYTGARQSGLRALDLRDFYPRVSSGEQSWLEFHNREDTGTRLKNGIRGERPVGVPDETARVLQEFIRENRVDSHDEYGRQALFSTYEGRAVEGTVRSWSYATTLPCLHGACPHGKERETCKWTDHDHTSKCPSSRSPHHIRTGSITWQLNIGIPPEVVAERVNATVKTIEDHYDWASDEERWRRYRDRLGQRREYVDRLDSASDYETDN